MSAARRRGLWAGAVWIAMASAPAAAGYESVAVLQALDKVTGRVFTLDVAVDASVSFGALQILPSSCYKAPPEEAPESAAFLEINEIKSGEPPRLLFRGWMFASSPSLSTLEHPIYDVIVLDCGSPDTAQGDPPITVQSLPSARSSE
ncbi:MAG: DUF2155 domain-containing protein [Alphaproteobacteria bacterium]|nr:DUF2155 domain-containing protein [Alphaproteobacteria bacterium]